MSQELARIDLSKLEPGTATRVEAGPNGICLVRVGGEVYALEDRCSHAEVRLSEGEVDPEELTVECWKHGSCFSLLDGTPQSLPATHPVRVYRVRRQGEQVVVEDQ